MKAYILDIQLIDAMPKVWREVIVPAGITYHRLHQVIQAVTNFNDSHLYEFDLMDEEMVVTTDDMYYQEHKAFMANRHNEERRLSEMDEQFKMFEERRQERLRKTVRKPESLTIDSYLENHKDFVYFYDFGDDWRIHVQLNDVVEDYYFGFPTLLNGGGIAPPEDVGGIPGYEHFVEAYYDKKHEDHEQLKSWAESDPAFREYDPDFLNRLLKVLKFKKTEWDQVEHKNYKIISDKYRKSEV